MKFRTIVITRKIILYTASVIIGIILCIVTFVSVKTKSTEVFGWKKNAYDKILSEGLPDYSQKDFSLKSIVSSLLGFDADKPETIINEYSAAFKRTTPAENAGADNTDTENGENASSGNDAETGKGGADNTDYGDTEDTGDEANSAPDTPDSPPGELPTHEEICSAAGLKMSNATHYSADLDALCAEALKIKPDSYEPQVLVVHTHTTECYDGDQMSGETERTTDENFNVIAIGNEICRVLEQYGIKTVHDTTYHDYPSYQGAYTRALSTIDKNLKAYPSVNVVLDVHRDAFVYSDGSKLAVRCEQNGIPTSQVMLVVGTNSMGLWHDNWRENLKFAAKIQNAAEIMYPGLMRPINLRTERFNQHMTPGSLILEVGSNGNKIEEAKEGGKDIARAIAAAMING